MIKSSSDNYRKSSTECLAIGFCLYTAITFNRRENCEQINNVSSVTQYPNDPEPQMIPDVDRK